MTKNNLFKDFNPVSTKEWKQKIQADLKGADYNDVLVWNTNESIDVKPFYNQDDIEGLNISPTQSTEFNIGQTVFVNDVEKSNLKAKTLLKNGVEVIRFFLPENSIDLTLLLQDISNKNIQIQLGFISKAFFETHRDVLSEHNISIISDPIHQLVSDGNWFINLQEDLNIIKQQILDSNSISINAEIYQNAGALIHQELAYILAHLNEYFNVIKDEKISDTLKISVNLAVGTNYFFEIAKLRALKILINSISESYNFNTEIIINATPTKRNKTLYDYNTNMLRTTTECMSAILGGATNVFNLSYDSIYHKDNAFGERISRNQLLILKGESYFNTVLNPSDGSYYIESLTHQLSENALNLFKDIEANGGFLSQLKSGTIQKKIKESAQKEQDAFNSKDITILGSNKFENPEDKMKGNLELYPFIKQNPRKTLIEPILQKRLTETYEKERLNQE